VVDDRHADAHRLVVDGRALEAVLDLQRDAVDDLVTEVEPGRVVGVRRTRVGVGRFEVPDDLVARDLTVVVEILRRVLAGAVEGAVAVEVEAVG
jgi:hypothetical protein